MALNFESDQFDPAQALAAIDITVPDPDAKPLNNLSEYFNLMKGNVKTVSKKKTEMSRQDYQKVAPNPIRFDSVKPRRRIKNVLTIMENIQGPLGCLRKCMAESIRVKVWIRRGKEMRGMCQGFVLAFDRHWNIVLGDVDEIYVLPKRIKVPPDIGQAGAESATNPRPTTGEELDVIQRRQRHGKSNMVIKQRHIDQLFVRGDGVALVSIGKTGEQTAKQSDESGIDKFDVTDPRASGSGQN